MGIPIATVRCGVPVVGTLAALNNATKVRVVHSNYALLPTQA